MLRIGSEVCVGPRLKRTCEPPEGSEARMKLEPFTVSVKDGPPAVAALGEIEVIAGTGFAAGFTRKVSVLERPFMPVPEKGLSVLTKLVPAFAMRAAETVAVTVDAL